MLSMLVVMLMIMKGRIERVIKSNHQTVYNAHIERLPWKLICNPRRLSLPHGILRRCTQEYSSHIYIMNESHLQRVYRDVCTLTLSCLFGLVCDSKMAKIFFLSHSSLFFLSVPRRNFFSSLPSSALAFADSDE